MIFCLSCQSSRTAQGMHACTRSALGRPAFFTIAYAYLAFSHILTSASSNNFPSLTNSEKGKLLEPGI